MVASKSLVGALALASFVAAENIDVKVGEGGLKFVPDNIKAKQGDNIVFHFVAGHHDVTLGKYSDPCMPIDGATIWSGVIDTVEKGKGVTFTVPVQDDKPKWFYCGVAKHCQNGMSLVLNEPSSGDSQRDYKDRAKLVPKSGVATEVKGGTLGGSGGSGGSSSSSQSSGSSMTSTSGIPDATLIPSGSIPSATQTGSTTGSSSHSATGSATGTAITGTTSPTASPGAAAGLKGSAVLAGLVAFGAWVGLL
ncbi:uncharacterized protein GIQ15_02424 [Arthroderma uncinatum]|uniref:uncharacterized protein n=1 Tax=Arthroderma uncinatum TaxID=74035 RepID=UPI00144AAE6F|nr:uncharacterized protein GIQ15_02424 [Arthroderma uncinatum]KAF3483100.1 hypothetical protein GIQ15_02424 [Arthroderma uncinatum]